MPEATNSQINELCEIADETLQRVLQSHFNISEEEAALVIENHEKLKEAFQTVMIQSIAEIIGRKP